jgi:hypothetical protein
MSRYATAPVSWRLSILLKICHLHQTQPALFCQHHVQELPRLFLNYRLQHDTERHPPPPAVSVTPECTQLRSRSPGVKWNVFSHA